ncbi:EAL domain-containing protein [Sphingobium sp. Ant17]|uniref:EAL domain-containing protein n=1 Tax=Sphingobium sp. Ant17 TaxID=1461752 RepID=UPI0004BC6C9A|nr:EAL domain-containing protein [Sphingobium sp. Ant17]
MNLRTGALEGFEALLRFNDPQRGLQPPGEIRAAFEDAELAVRLTDRMLDCIMADMAAWRDQGFAFGRVAFNGAPGDFRRGDFVDRILGRLHTFGLPACLLELEVTETVFVGQLSDRVHNSLETLAKAGVTIALDDFGTGYASLTHLQQFPVHTIKIDRSFVSRLNAAETGDAAIVGAVIDLAKNLGITTVAEGIETAAQAAHLMVKGCDVGQGFLFGRPMARSQTADIMAKWDAPGMIGLCAGSDWAEMLRSSISRQHPGTPLLSEAGRS